MRTFSLLAKMAITLGLLAYLLMVVPFLGNPSLLALFVVLKFDPVAFEVMACAALIAAGELNKVVHHQLTRKK